MKSPRLGVGRLPAVEAGPAGREAGHIEGRPFASTPYPVSQSIGRACLKTWEEEMLQQNGKSKHCRIAGAAVAAAALAILISTPANSADYKFAIIQAVVNPYYATWPQAAKDASADFGIAVEIGSPQDFDQVQQDAVVNSFIAKGIKGLGIQPVDAVAGAETVKRVVAAGVPVIGVAACAELKG